MNYSHLMRHIAEIAKNCGRDPSTIKLIAVTKNRSLKMIQLLFNDGCRDFAESYVQEALDKQEEISNDIFWHFIGSLQRNKVRKVIGRFSLIHSVDSLSLAKKISAVSQELGLITNCLLEINTSKEETKYGLPEDFSIDEFIRLPNIAIKGLMTMAANTDDKSQIRENFACLRNLRDRLEKEGDRLPHLSMGMSRDYPIAIEEGATLLRIGGLLFSEGL